MFYGLSKQQFTFLVLLHFHVFKEGYVTFIHITHFKPRGMQDMMFNLTPPEGQKKQNMGLVM